MAPSAPPLPCRGLQWSGRTVCGPVRPNNEDAFVGLRFDAHEVQYLGAIGEGLSGEMDFAFAVSDGMGGAKAGEYASRIAVEKLIALLPRSYRKSPAISNEEHAAVLEQLFAQTHESLQHLGRSYAECRGMEATLSLCWFTPSVMYFGHVGDSRIYHLSQRSGSFQQITQDDTYVGWLFRNGKISEREARTHPRRNLLQKALGGGNQFVSPQVGSVAYEPGDQFLLCTDGLVDGFYDEQLGEFLRSSACSTLGASSASLIVNDSLARSGRDNTTALVVRAI